MQHQQTVMDLLWLGFTHTFRNVVIVPERQVFTIEEAVRKMTSVPASVYRLDRGILEEGKSADICVFHLENLQSLADFANPDRLCTGFDYVFTGGKPCVVNDRWTNTGTGTVL